jgi:hypothetical protein
VTDNLLPEMKALLADVRARMDRAVPWDEARPLLTLRLQAAAHAEVDDPLARAAVTALCHRLVRNASDPLCAAVAPPGGDPRRRKWRRLIAPDDTLTPDGLLR